MLHYTEYAMILLYNAVTYIIPLKKKKTNTSLLYCFLILVVSKLGNRILKSLIHGAQPDLRWQPSLV